MPPRAASSAMSPTSCAPPLSNIKSYVETLHDMGDLLSPAEQKEFLSIANAETDRLSRLVTDVLDLSRLESDRVWQLEPMEIGPAIEQTLRTYRLNAEEKGVVLIFAGDGHLPRVRGNWDLLLQVFDNLVGNAIKFTQGGGQLLLRAYPWPDHCLLDPDARPGDHPSCALTSPLPRFISRNFVINLANCLDLIFSNCFSIVLFFH